jgi:hypothetical protein
VRRRGRHPRPRLLVSLCIDDTSHARRCAGDTSESMWVTGMSYGRLGLLRCPALSSCRRTYDPIIARAVPVFVFVEGEWTGLATVELG